MKRLTTKFDGGYLFNLPPQNDEKAQNEYIDKLSIKLGEYEDAEEKGLLFKMPCKPGDIVWILISSTKEIKSFKVSKITIGKNHDSITMTDKSIFTIWGKNWNEYFNRFVYPTKEAAEQALQQIQEET